MIWKPISLAGACFVALLLAAVLSPVLGDSPRSGYSPTDRVIIDGKSFLPKETGHDDFSPVRRELEKFGIEVPVGFGGSPGAAGAHPVFSSGVAGADGPPYGDPPVLPQGLTADHTLRLESVRGEVDLVLGRMQSRGALIRNRLVADGWVAPAQENVTGSPRLLEMRTGKETMIVCFDEAEGTFLLLRETGR